MEEETEKGAKEEEERRSGRVGVLQGERGRERDTRSGCWCVVVRCVSVCVVVVTLNYRQFMNGCFASISSVVFRHF